MSERQAWPRAVHGLSDSEEPESLCQVSKEYNYQGYEWLQGGEAAGVIGKMKTDGLGALKMLTLTGATERPTGQTSACARYRTPRGWLS